GKSDILSRGRGGALPSEQTRLTLHSLEVVLEHVPALIARLLFSEPIGAHRVEFLPEDSDALLLHKGYGLGACADAILSNETTAGRQARGRAPHGDLLVCSAQVDSSHVDHLLKPYVIWDGFHRAAEWFVAAHQGGSQPRLGAYLIETRKPL